MDQSSQIYYLWRGIDLSLSSDTFNSTLIMYNNNVLRNLIRDNLFDTMKGKEHCNIKNNTFFETLYYFTETVKVEAPINGNMLYEKWNIKDSTASGMFYVVKQN